MKVIVRADVEHMVEDRYIGSEYGSVRYRSGRAMYEATLVIRTDEREWIEALFRYMRGETEQPPPMKAPELISAAPALPPAPIEGTFEDE